MKKMGKKTMDLNNLTVFNMAKQNMNYLSLKEKVIAGNIANASTPNYLAKDVTKPSFLDSLKESKPLLELTKTNSKHIGELKSVANKNHMKNVAVVYTPKPSDSLTIDGNGVILEDQMNEASKASSEYKRMITIYNSYKKMLSTANTKING